MSQSRWFWVGGLFLTGMTFIILGLVLGRLGRAAREAELLPTEGSDRETTGQHIAAANPPPGLVNGEGNGAAPPPPPKPPAQPPQPVVVPQQ